MHGKHADIKNQAGFPNMLFQRRSAVACGIAGLITGVSASGLLPTSAEAEMAENFWTKKIENQRAAKRARRATRAQQRNVGASAAEVSAVVPLSSTCEAEAEPYREARAAYASKAARYWAAVERKRKTRRARKAKKLALRRADYVTSYPPSYEGPRRPKCLDRAKVPKTGKKKPSTLPLEADFRRNAKRIYGFTPRSTSEWNYKTAFAREALSVGLTAEQVVGVYALETGGIGPYFRQSGIFPVDQKCRPLKRHRGRAASTALSYAQLLAANTNIMAREMGPELAERLERRARHARGARADELRGKARILRAMARDIRRGLARQKGSPWTRYRAFAKTSRGQAVHALLLDADIGPILQVHKLRKIVAGAKRAGFSRVSSAQLELMNLAGPGTGLEMMTPLGAKMPTANFFSRGGHDRNPVVKNRTGAGLLNKLAERISAQMTKCGSKEFLAAFRNVSG
ncbi:MAG: hypothetical protein AAFZ01_03035 [Pseudomonadota bacterium]